MERRRLAPLVGIVGCLLVLVALAVPYALVRTAPGSAVAGYYGEGVVNPLVGALFALVGIIVLAAGREDRTDPGFAAGVALVLGLFLTALLSLWATTVPFDVIAGMDAPAFVQHHRWAMVGVSLIVPAASAVWARTLGLL